MSWGGFITVTSSPATDTGDGVEWLGFVVRTTSDVSEDEARRGAQILSNILIAANAHAETPIRRELWSDSQINFETGKAEHAAGSRFSIMKGKHPDHDGTRDGRAKKLAAATAPILAATLKNKIDEGGKT